MFIKTSGGEKKIPVIQRPSPQQSRPSERLLSKLACLPLRAHPYNEYHQVGSRLHILPHLVDPFEWRPRAEGRLQLETRYSQGDALPARGSYFRLEICICSLFLRKR